MQKVTLNKLVEMLEMLTEDQQEIKNRLVKMENQVARPSTSRPSAKTSTARPTVKKSAVQDLKNIFVPVPHPKYPKVKAIYVWPNGKVEEKIFWGRKRMNAFDYTALKIHGSFKKYTDMPSVSK
jgi:hypothetical protein